MTAARRVLVATFPLLAITEQAQSRQFTALAGCKALTFWAEDACDALVIAQREGVVRSLIGESQGVR